MENPRLPYFTAVLPMRAAIRQVSLAAALLLAADCNGQTPEPCPKISAESKERITRVAARQLRTEPSVPVIDREALVPGTCYLQLFVSLPSPNRRTILYLTPDHQFLSPALWDLSTDPETAEAQLAAKLVQEAKAAGAPSTGPDSAPVTIVLFSDFQCPFCANLATMLERFRTAKPSDIRIFFRNLPSTAHNWAAQAARSGVCIAQQSAEAFWAFHEMLFSEQKSLSLDLVPAATTKFIAGNLSLKEDAYMRCMASSLPDARIQRDISDAHSHDAHGTPTVFINGRKYAGFRDEEAFTAAIRASLSSNLTKEGALHR